MHAPGHPVATHPTPPLHVLVLVAPVVSWLLPDASPPALVPVLQTPPMQGGSVEACSGGSSHGVTLRAIRGGRGKRSKLSATVPAPRRNDRALHHLVGVLLLHVGHDRGRKWRRGKWCVVAGALALDPDVHIFSFPASIGLPSANLDGEHILLLPPALTSCPPDGPRSDHAIRWSYIHLAGPSHRTHSNACWHYLAESVLGTLLAPCSRVHFLSKRLAQLEHWPAARMHTPLPDDTSCHALDRRMS